MYVISDLNSKATFGTFYEKELKKTNQTKFRVEKVIKRKGDIMLSRKVMIMCPIVE